MAHTIVSMMKIGPASKALMNALPAEFSKQEFNDLRKQMGGDALAFVTARRYGYIQFVRSEPCTYHKHMEIYVDPVTGRQFNGWQELWDAWSNEIARHFGVDNRYAVQGEWGEVEFQGVRNIYTINPNPADWLALG